MTTSPIQPVISPASLIVPVTRKRSGEPAAGFFDGRMQITTRRRVDPPDPRRLERLAEIVVTRGELGVVLQEQALGSASPRDPNASISHVSSAMTGRL